MDIKTKEYRIIMLVVVMNEESKPIISKLSLKPDPNFVNPFCDCYKSQFKTFQLSLFKPKCDPKYKVDSIGSEVSAITTYIGIEWSKPDLVISLGSCGGVIGRNNNVHDFKIGDVCVGKEGIGFFDREMIIKDYQDYQEGKYEILSLAKLHKKLNLKEVIVGTTSSFTSDQTLAETKKVDIVEMEAAAVGKVCYWTKTPFYVLKVISDLDEPDQAKRVKMFENFLGNVSEALANKLIEFLEALEAKDY